jgi:hypothetical protein
MTAEKNTLKVVEEKGLQWFDVKRNPGNRFPRSVLEWEQREYEGKIRRKMDVWMG